MLGPGLTAQLLATTLGASAPDSSPPKVTSAAVVLRHRQQRRQIAAVAAGAGAAFVAASVSGWLVVEAATTAERERLRCDTRTDFQLFDCPGLFGDETDPTGGQAVWGSVHVASTLIGSGLTAVATSQAARLRHERGRRSLHPAASLTLGSTVVAGGVAGMTLGYVVGTRDCERWTVDSLGRVDGTTETASCQRLRDRQAIPAMILGSLAVMSGAALIGDGVGVTRAQRALKVSAGPTLDGAAVSLSGRF